MKNKQIEIFFDKLKTFVNNYELIKLSINNKRDKSADLKSIIVTIAQLKRGYRLNFVYRHETKDITKNYEFAEGIDLIKTALEKDFYNADIFANSENINLIGNPDGKGQIKTGNPSMRPLTEFKHDKVKNRLIQTIDNVYLRELGVTNNGWEVRREMSDKFKQINRYTELLEPYFKEMAITDCCHIVDMGSGKGYLTFALYDYLVNYMKLNVRMTGVEFREELINTCNAISQKAGFSNLSFVKGTIEKADIGHIDILIALHACNTATDEAIYRGIKSDADLIVCAPCCHKQIRRAFNVSNELAPVMKYGILKERQAEIITDSLRALYMEAFGYKTNVFEFIETAHTPKNVMIVGKKVISKKDDKQQILSQIDAIKKMFGIKRHYLGSLLTINNS